MRVLVACEYSGIVRDAFRAAGHDAVSCDLRESERPGPHIRGDVRDQLGAGWDLLIAHPPCTYLANSGVHLLTAPPERAPGALSGRERWQAMEQAARFFLELLEAPVPRVAVENPLPHGHARKLIGPYSDRVHPWMFGDPYNKAVCLWLRGLPPLLSTVQAAGRASWVMSRNPGARRSSERARSFPGIARAMAEQWGAMDPDPVT